MLTTRPKGTNDFVPGESEKWQYIEQLCRQVCAEYGYKEIRLPIFEHTEVYLRSVGETSDIVEKEMYSFEDKGFTHVTLRPEGTAGTVRAFLENKLYADPQPTKLYYMGPMFRYDKPCRSPIHPQSHEACRAVVQVLPRSPVSQAVSYTHLN